MRCAAWAADLTNLVCNPSTTRSKTTRSPDVAFPLRKAMSVASETASRCPWKLHFLSWFHPLISVRQRDYHVEYTQDCSHIPPTTPTAQISLILPLVTDFAAMSTEDGSSLNQKPGARIPDPSGTADIEGPAPAATTGGATSVAQGPRSESVTSNEKSVPSQAA